MPRVRCEPEAGSAPRSPSGNGVTEDQSPPVASRERIQRARCRIRPRSSRIPWSEAMSQTGTRSPRQHFEQAHAVRRAGGAGEREHDGMRASPVSARSRSSRAKPNTVTRHDAVHGEEGRVEPREVARTHELVLVGQDPRRHDQAGEVPAPEARAPAEQRQRRDGDRRGAAWPAGSRAARPAARRRSADPAPGRSPRRAGRRRCRTPPPRSRPPAVTASSSQAGCAPPSGHREVAAHRRDREAQAQPEVRPPGEPLGEAVESGSRRARPGSAAGRAD